MRRGLIVAMVLLVGCGGEGEPEPSARSTTSVSTDASTDGAGRHVAVATLQEPPKSPSGGVTAEQAEGVSGTVIDAWLEGDRARAERFATTPDAIAELFAVLPPSQELTDEGRAYCSQDEATKSFTRCSYSVVDGSADGIFAVATEVTVANGLVLVRAASAADWND